MSVDKVSFAGLLASLYDSAVKSCNRKASRNLVAARNALPEQGLPQAKSDLLVVAFQRLDAAQKLNEGALVFLREYYGIKLKAKKS